MSDSHDDRLDLFLARADDGRPALPDGLPGEASKRAPRPRKDRGGKDSHDWRRLDGDPNDLALQRWAVIAPEGAEGDAQIQALAPLIRLREEEQGTAAVLHRVPRDMDGSQALAWKQDVFWPEGVPEDDVPLYAVILGDLDQVSAELQHVLATDTLVGRIHFSDGAGRTDLAGYAAYAGKVVHLARSTAVAESGDLLFYAAADGSSATVTGKSRLVEPSFEASQDSLAAGRLPAASVSEIEAESVGELLSAAALSRPGVLLSLSHGLGAPRGGWRSEAAQWQKQGAMVVGEGEILDAERLRGQPFLPGGVWLYLACFGAGTPETSAYHQWLSLLAQEDAYRGSLSSVLASLPASGERPFLAALPQVALRNPDGPLAVIGHLDLAWTYGFSGITNFSETRKSRVLAPLEILVRGSRTGVALGALLRAYTQANDALLQSYELESQARHDRRPDPTNRAERATLWMLRNDLRGYVLLGDPAARLPLKKNALAAAPSAPAIVPAASTATLDSASPAWTPPARATGPLSPEAAVEAMLHGEEAPRSIAERAGVSLATLWQWVDDYRAAGRARLAGGPRRE
jgi:hypothetical protein